MNITKSRFKIKMGDSDSDNEMINMLSIQSANSIMNYEYKEEPI